MNKSRILVTTLCGLLLFLSIDMAASQASPSSRNLDDIKDRIYQDCSPVQIDALILMMQQEILNRKARSLQLGLEREKNFLQAESYEQTVAFWEKSGVSNLESIVSRDLAIQKTKVAQIERLFKKECSKYSENDRLSFSAKKQILAHMQQNKDKICKRLWLDCMYGMKNKIERLEKSTSSHLASPYIKEIHTVRNINNSCWNASLP